MNIYLKLTGRTFTIWLLTAFINGLLSGIAVAILNNEHSSMAEFCLVIGLLSGIFSVPGFLIFWLVLLIKAARKVTERALFRSALSAGFMLSAATATCGYELLFNVLKNYAWVLVLIIILATVISIMIHFKNFKNLN